MEITYLGHSCFKLRGKEGTVITDPFDPQAVGLTWNKTKADVVTVSHQHPDHNYVKDIQATANRQAQGIFVIDGAGEYEVNNILIQGWLTYHDSELGVKRGKNIIYLIELEKTKILHCGDLGHQLSDKLIEEIGQVDVLLIPIGGHYTIDAQTAAQITQTVSPGVVIPMHYQTPGLNQETFKDLTGIELFLKEMGTPAIEPLDKFTFTSDSSGNTRVVVLKT